MVSAHPICCGVATPLLPPPPTQLPHSPRPPFPFLVDTQHQRPFASHPAIPLLTIFCKAFAVSERLSSPSPPFSSRNTPCKIELLFCCCFTPLLLRASCNLLRMFVNDEQGHQIPCIPFSAKNKMPVKQCSVALRPNLLRQQQPVFGLYNCHTFLRLTFPATCPRRRGLAEGRRRMTTGRRMRVQARIVMLRQMRLLGWEG
jgi:hypothetical protein